MKTTVKCVKCGKEISHLEHYYGMMQDVSVRYIKGDEYVLGDHLICGDPEVDGELDYYKCPLCKKGICSSDSRALEFLQGE